jgi:hypothetical protein
LGVTEGITSGEGDEGGLQYAINATIAATAVQIVAQFHSFFLGGGNDPGFDVNPNKFSHSSIVWGRASGCSSIPFRMA